MKKSIYRVLGVTVLFGAMFALGGTKEASAGLQVNIGIAAPPPLQFAAPPDVYVVPSGSSYVYMVPDYDGIYFYGGNWYRYYNDDWFRSSRYNGDGAILSRLSSRKSSKLYRRSIFTTCHLYITGYPTMISQGLADMGSRTALGQL